MYYVRQLFNSWPWNLGELVRLFYFILFILLSVVKGVFCRREMAPLYSARIRLRWTSCGER